MVRRLILTSAMLAVATPIAVAQTTVTPTSVPGPCFKEITQDAFNAKEKAAKESVSLIKFMQPYSPPKQQFYVDGIADWADYGRGIAFQFGKKTPLVTGFSLKVVIHLPKGKGDVTRYYHTVEENMRNGKLNILLRFGLDLGAVTGVDLVVIMDDPKVCANKLTATFTWPRS